MGPFSVIPFRVPLRFPFRKWSRKKKTLHSSVTLGQPQLTNSKEVNGNRDSDYYKTDGSCR